MKSSLFLSCTLSLCCCFSLTASAVELTAKLNQLQLQVVHNDRTNSHLASALQGERSVQSTAYQSHLPSQLQVSSASTHNLTATDLQKIQQGLANVIAVQEETSDDADDSNRRTLAKTIATGTTHQDSKTSSSSNNNNNNKDDTPLEPEFFMDVVAPMNFQNMVLKNPGMLDQLAGGHQGGVVAEKTSNTATSTTTSSSSSMQDFTTDVVMPPIELIGTADSSALGTVYSASNQQESSPAELGHRNLQQLECFQQTDGSLACVLDDFPRPGLILIFFGCPNRVGATVFDCGGCRIVEEVSAQLVDPTDPLCTACELCTTQQSISFDCSNIDTTENCAEQDCEGNCIGTTTGGGSTTPPPAPAGGDAIARCFPQDNGSVACTVEDFPRDGLILVFLNCPTFSGSTLLDCNSCTVVEEDETTEIDNTDPQCSSCALCGDTVAFNCANLDPGVACAVQNCAGGCVGGGGGGGGGPNPTPMPVAAAPTGSPPTQPTQAEPGEVTCFPNGDTTACALENFPRPGLIIVFFDCPTTLGSTLFDCATCGIIEEDDLTLISDDSVRCNGCTVCRENSLIGFDCANVKPNDSCAIQDCNNQCTSGDGGAPFGGGTSGAGSIAGERLFPVSILMAVAALVMWS